MVLVYHLDVHSHCSICSTEENWQKELNRILQCKILQKTKFALLASTKVGVCSYIYIYNKDSQSGKGIKYYLDLNDLWFSLH